MEGCRKNKFDDANILGFLWSILDEYFESLIVDTILSFLVLEEFPSENSDLSKFSGNWRKGNIGQNLDDWW
jgi:hypothetical protein